MRFLVVLPISVLLPSQIGRDWLEWPPTRQGVIFLNLVFSGDGFAASLANELDDSKLLPEQFF